MTNANTEALEALKNWQRSDQDPDIKYEIGRLLKHHGILNGVLQADLACLATHLFRAALARKTPDHREAVTQWLSAFGMVAIDKDELSELQRTREAEAVPVAWEERYGLLAEDFELRGQIVDEMTAQIVDLKAEIETLKAAPTRFPSREEVSRTIYEACDPPKGVSQMPWEDFTTDCPQWAERFYCQADAVIALYTQGEAQTTNDGALREAAKLVVAWWLETGMHKFNAAPYAMFALRKAHSEDLPKVCKNTGNPKEACTLHNLHCAYPDCMTTSNLTNGEG